MKPVYIPEEKYDYNIHAKSGFFSCMMEEPGMGFGEKTYRYLFSGQLIKPSFRKKKRRCSIPPYYSTGRTDDIVLHSHRRNRLQGMPGE